MPGQLGHDLQGLPGVDQIPTEGVAEGMGRVIREADPNTGESNSELFAE